MLNIIVGLFSKQIANFHLKVTVLNQTVTMYFIIKLFYCALIKPLYEEMLAIDIFPAFVTFTKPFRFRFQKMFTVCSRNSYSLTVSIHN